MIKTSYKSHPIKGFTHSIGTKQISEMLSGIGIYNDLSISFNKEKGHRMGVSVPGWNGRTMKGQSRDLLGFWRVISGTYSKPLDKWTINLKAVEIENNKRIKKFLIEIGIPLLRNWFESEKPETWYNGHRNLLIGLNENLTEYCTWETHNDRTVKKTTELINTSKKLSESS
ncbi:hypothetical protein KO506_06895 [Polaribacter vadi]|uniref:hypothetical protein n=1 Tax=Polaribacter TaxID=52959 RepID=UPI001C0878A8|nr:MULTISPECIES: hypothetical protein [Polaribacter]MBU3011123.1 hypothetical protein [Polaribacter vadi]MDO6740937.1 hypothetical protein [Polaribacter sp. 1_MG-2023]